MKKLFLVTAAIALLAFGATGSVMAYQVDYNFNTTWTGDYAANWENSDYRHGTAPVGKMMEQVSQGRNETRGMKLIADSTQNASLFWAGVNPTNINAAAMAKEYDPYISAWYYDAGLESGSLHSAGQIYAVPSWVNPYTNGEDWTDVQFGARRNTAEQNLANNYYYIASGQNAPSWQETTVTRTAGWVNLKMQLSSTDGYIHFYVNTTEVGKSYRNDYKDLGGVGLYTMFTAPLSGWGDNKPATVWDDVQVGSTAAVPEPGTILAAISILGPAGLIFRRRKSA